MSPVFDLSGATGPTLEFDSYFRPFLTSNGVVELSSDGGTTWKSVYDIGSKAQFGHVKLALASTDATATVQIRFHYTGSFAYFWELDNVFVGNRKAVPVPGGLLAGLVKDGNTGAFVKGARVTSDRDATLTATTGPTGDPAVGDGYYWMFSPLTGSQPFTATKSGYGAQSGTALVRANLSNRLDFTLRAGRVDVTPASVTATVKMGTSTSKALTLENTGTLPVAVQLGESDGGFVMASRTGAPQQTVKTQVFTGSAKANAAKAAARSGARVSAAPKTVAPSADAWEPVADLPTTVQDSSAVFSGGKLYTVGGYNGRDDTADLYAFDPQAASWAKLASATVPREAGRIGEVAGSLVWTGGWGPGGDPTGITELYDPAGDSWSLGAKNPKPYSAAGVAVVGSKMYLVGGCTGSACGTKDVQVYDAAADSWSSAATYPEPIAWEACGAIDAKIYCAGGNTDAASVTSAYSYDPATDAWAPVADLPADLWGSFSTAANGQLLVSGGVVDHSAAITNTGYAYDPANDAWSPLPNLNTALYRGSGAVGFYAVGGNPGGSTTPPVATTQLLAGYAQGGSADVPWLGVDPTELTLAPVPPRPSR